MRELPLSGRRQPSEASHGPFSHPRILDERRRLARLREAGVSVARIAERLGGHASDIHREPKRNHFVDDVPVDVTGFFAIVVNDFAKERRARGAELRRDPGLDDGPGP